MDHPFVYSSHVTGKNFIGRKAEIANLTNLFSLDQNVAIYEPPKAGKTSLLQQTFFNMKIAGQKFFPVEVSLLTVRSRAEFACKVGGKIIRHFATTPAEYSQAVASWLPGTHFIFDPDAYAATDNVLSLNWDLDDDDIRAIISLPYRIAAESGDKIYVVLDEFQNILRTEDGEGLCKLFEGVLKGLGEEDRRLCNYVFCGSCVNAMAYIFEHKRYFHRLVERCVMRPVERKDIIEHVVKGFLVSGKVTDRDLLSGFCDAFRDDLYYINHFASICDSLSKGYIMEPVLMEALEMMLSIHEPRFRAIMNDLTTFQVQLLRAILDGNKKFSSSDVIRKYSLNSSANVCRLKEALCRKEIVVFDADDEPTLLDPLFEYWVGRYFYGRQNI